MSANAQEKLPVPDEEEQVVDAAAAVAEVEEDMDPLHIGNIVGIVSEKYGMVVGRIVYRNVDMIRIVSQEASDRAVEFPLIEEGTQFEPSLGVTAIETIETQDSDYFVDTLGVQPGEMLEFFTTTGEEAAPSGEVKTIIKTPNRDALELTDGRVLNFRGIGPEAPIAVIRVRTSLNVPPPMEDTAAEAAAAAEAVASKAKRQQDLLALLRGVLPAATVEVIPAAERVYPESMQREDLLQDLLADLKPKQRSNPRQIRRIERDVDLAMALKNRVGLRDKSGRLVGLDAQTINTIDKAVSESTVAIPAAIPIVDAGKILNIDKLTDMTGAPVPFKDHDVTPRIFDEVEMQSELRAELFLEGSIPKPYAGITGEEEARALVRRGFNSYMFDLLGRDQQTLHSNAADTGRVWTQDQDVIRTAGLSDPVQGLIGDLAGSEKRVKLEYAVTPAFLKSDVVDRSMRVLTADTQTFYKTGETTLIAPSDPAEIRGYVMLPIKAALALRPPKQSGSLPMALLYSQALQNDNLPTIAKTLVDLYGADEPSPSNAWTMEKEKTTEFELAKWLETVLPLTVHPADALGPRTPYLLGVLDALGLGQKDLSPAVSAVIGRWVGKCQGLWRDLLVKERTRIQAILDAEPPRTFQSVVGDDSPLWSAGDGSLMTYEPLRDLVASIQARNPTIASSSLLLTSGLMTEAQGDATPLVWAAIANIDNRPAPIDIQKATTSLAASRALTLRRKALQDIELLKLKAAPEISTCPHAPKLEAIRNIRDPLQKSRLLRDFVEEYQGGKRGDWMTCALCKADCVCYHELMELEALAQPARMEAIQRQILIRFGGERFSGKVICKNCGQALQDIDYDDKPEFDDEGNVIAGRSVLTEEQMADPTETTWRKTTAALASTIEFSTPSQRMIADSMQLILERAGILVQEAQLRSMVRLVDLYVGQSSPAPEAYEAMRRKMIASAKTAIAKSTGAAVSRVADVQTYEQVIDLVRIKGIAAIVALQMQTANPPLEISNPFPICKFSRRGWPVDPAAKPEDDGAIHYISCVVAGIQRDFAPWRTLPWAGEPKLESRQKKVFTVVSKTVEMLLSGSFSITPEIKAAIEKAREMEETMEAYKAVSRGDVLPAGFRPEPFPVPVSRPALERNPIPNIQAAIEGRGVPAEMVVQTAAAVHQQGAAIVVELHKSAETAIKGLGQKPTGISHTVCCPTTLADVEKGVLLGAPPQPQLLVARDLLHGAVPSAINAGSHLWAAMETPVTQEIEQIVDEGVLFKLFLRYCYTGPNVGELHEFSVGNVCRQCGLRLGKPLDLVDFNAEGAGILAAQQGSLQIDINMDTFNALSDVIRRSKIIQDREPAAESTWMVALQEFQTSLQRAFPQIAETLGQILQALDLTQVYTETDRALVWSSLVGYMDELRATVVDRIGPMQPAGKPRAREAMKAIAQLASITEDPYVEGPRVLQEYWCAKTEAMGRTYENIAVPPIPLYTLSRTHKEMMERILKENSNWYGGEITDQMKISGIRMAEELGPVLKKWMDVIRSNERDPAMIWTVTEAQILLRTVILQMWADLVSPNSWIYQTLSTPADREMTANAMANWTRALMLHISQQYTRFSEERIRQILQQRAELERTSVVQEFESIKDDDERAAALMLKDFRIGRWSKASQIQKYDADMFEFESEQRLRMGIMDAAVDPIYLEQEGVMAAGAGGGPAGGDFGFNVLAEEATAYDVEQEAEDDA